LSPLDQALVLDTCAIASVPAKLPNEGLITSVLQNGIPVGWQGIASSAAGGQYRLCWCAGSTQVCSTAEDFAVDAGELKS
jgi:hypothetical protein